MNDLPHHASARFIRRLAICATVVPAFAIAACDRDARYGPEDARSASENVGWAGYNNGYHGQRFAALDQINTRNVAQLKSVCELKLGEFLVVTPGHIRIAGRPPA
jgi:glucose dehydrogenase